LASQQPEATLERLTVDLWPDYDRPSVLVLLTGSISADATLPVDVTLPLPSDAMLNAVARISNDNQMIDDISFERGDDTLTLTTPDRRFRVEYYMPYEAEGLQRTFSYVWSGGPAVSQLDIGVQQPQAATSIDVQPAPEAVIEGNDGLQYHNLAIRQLQPAEPFSVEVNYTLTSEQLTAPGAAPASTSNATAPVDDEAGSFLDSIDWPIILSVAGGVLLLLAVGWQVFGARLSARSAPRKPRPLRAMRQQQAQFCHQCGARAQEGDRFCRECGTELRRG
jgi:hypothetical protein